MTDKDQSRFGVYGKESVDSAHGPRRSRVDEANGLVFSGALNFVPGWRQPNNEIDNSVMSLSVAKLLPDYTCVPKTQPGQTDEFARVGIRCLCIGIPY